MHCIPHTVSLRRTACIGRPASKDIVLCNHHKPEMIAWSNAARGVCFKHIGHERAPSSPCESLAAKMIIGMSSGFPQQRVRVRYPIAAACAAIWLCSSAAVLAGPADDIKALLAAGKAAEAYALGSRHPDLLGDPAFDFHYGIAAVGNGHAAEGILALERYIVQFPDNAAARAELARGYFVLGDDARARQEFEALQKLNLPAQLAATIDRYIDAIRAREGVFRTTARAYVEAGIGHDSNVNSGVGSANINLPTFGTVQVAPGGMKISSMYTSIGAGGQISVPIGPGLAVFGGGSIESKANTQAAAEPFDLLSYGAAGGVSYLRGANLMRLTASHGQLEVDHNRFRKANALAGEWTHQLDEFQTITPSLQVGEFRYTGFNEVRNAQFTGATLTYRRALSHAWQPSLTLAASYGEERNQKSRPDLGRDSYGARAAIAISPAQQWSLAAGLSYQESRYHAADPLLSPEKRRDRYYAGDLTVVYAVTRDWSVRGEALIAGNRANIALYQYDRSQISFKLRYEFR